MWRAPAVFLGLALVCFFQFEFFPGHSYLASGTQLYVPALEHLVQPGYLSRDLVATHPNLAYTVYDEITGFLHGFKLDFRTALALQQVLCRFAGLYGLYLLARAIGLKRLPASAIATLVSLGTFLPGPNVWSVDAEPVPSAFSFALVLLAMGCIASQKQLLAGLFGGLAVLYDPVTAAPFWMVLLAAFLFDRTLRKLLRPIGPVLLIFLLLLANLSQLQPGRPDPQLFFRRFSPEITVIEKFRAPELWVSLWPPKYVYWQIAVFVISVWAVTRIWPVLTRQVRWLFTALPAIGILTVPLSFFLLEQNHWATVLRAEPMHLLLYTVTVAWISCAIAASRAVLLKARIEATAWSAVCILIFLVSLPRPIERMDKDITGLADWASTTWGSSMFLFPDAGRSAYPGIFRAQSRRAVWVDWEGGKQITRYVDLAPVWFDRCQMTMRGPLTGDRLQAMLSLPIDYYVFTKDHVVGSVTRGRQHAIAPVFRNASFTVYEAANLMAAPGTLTISRSAN